MRNNHENVDSVLIGADIMSATLGMLLKELMPDCTIKVLEQLDEMQEKIRMPGIMQVQDMLPCVN